MVRIPTAGQQQIPVLPGPAGGVQPRTRLDSGTQQRAAHRCEQLVQPPQHVPCFADCRTDRIPRRQGHLHGAHTRIGVEMLLESVYGPPHPRHRAGDGLPREGPGIVLLQERAPQTLRRAVSHTQPCCRFHDRKLQFQPDTTPRDHRGDSLCWYENASTSGCRAARSATGASTCLSPQSNRVLKTPRTGGRRRLPRLPPLPAPRPRSERLPQAPTAVVVAPRNQKATVRPAVAGHDLLSRRRRYFVAAMPAPPTRRTP